MTAPKRNRRPHSKGIRIALTLLALRAACLLSSQRGFAEGSALPDLKVPDLQGRLRTRADYPGRVTLLVFWEPDHERSVAALRELARLADRYEPSALAAIASGHSRADVERALTSCAVKTPALLDTDRGAFAAFQIVALPTAMIVSLDGKLLFKAAGFNAGGLGAIEAKLDEIYGRSKPAVSAPSGNPEALRRYGMAQQLLKLGMRAQAEKALADVTSRHPEFRPAWVSLGYCRIEENRADEARAAFEKARALEPAANDVAAGLAWIAWKKGDMGEATKWAAAVSDKDAHQDLVREVRKAGGPR